MLSKEKMFKITSVVMESGCTKYILYQNFGWLNLLCMGSRYREIGKYHTVESAKAQVNLLYTLAANSCMKSKEKQIWPN